MRKLIALVLFLSIAVLETGCSSKAEERERVMYVLFDASGQAFNCQTLRESNRRVVQAHIMKQIDRDMYTLVRFGVFSRRLRFVYDASMPENLPDSVTQSRFKREISTGIQNAIDNMRNAYSYQDGAHEKLMGSDVYGAITKTLDDIRVNKFEHAQIVIASPMIQSVNKGEVIDTLTKNHIQLGSSSLVLFSKAWDCSNGSADFQIRQSLDETASFWQSVIDGDIRIDYSY